MTQVVGEVMLGEAHGISQDVEGHLGLEMGHSLLGLLLLLFATAGLGFTAVLLEEGKAIDFY